MDRLACIDVRANHDRDVTALTERLRRFTPDVEPSREMPGVFWLNAQGLGRLYASLEVWARAIVADLAAAGFDAIVVVGFTRFGTYAVAKSGRHTRVFSSPRDELAAAGKVPLALVGLEPPAREFLAKLGVRTVGAFLRLPASAIPERLGAAAHRLHRLASGDLWAPLQPVPVPESFTRHEDLDFRERDGERLIFLIKRLLDSILADLAARVLALSGLWLGLTLDDRSERRERVRPAAPTLDAVQLMGLVRLRVFTLQLSSGVVAIHLEAEAERASTEQVRLFQAHAARDPAAASRAFARLRAAFGDDAVVRARLREAHLPRARFAWEPIDQLHDVRGVRLQADQIRLKPDPTVRPCVRRIYDQPQMFDRRGAGVDIPMQGPYIVSGRWWSGGGSIHRDYYFVRTARAEVLWIYYDRPRQAWFLEGRVE